MSTTSRDLVDIRALRHPRGASRAGNESFWNAVEALVHPDVQPSRPKSASTEVATAITAVVIAAGTLVNEEGRRAACITTLRKILSRSHPDELREATERLAEDRRINLGDTDHDAGLVCLWQAARHDQLEPLYAALPGDFFSATLPTVRRETLLELIQARYQQEEDGLAVAI